MSGGSYDYLFARVRPLSEQRHQLESMATRLEGLEWGAQAAAVTRRCLNLIDEAERLADTLVGTWRAVEWWDSCDWSEDQAREDVERYVPPDGQLAKDVLYRLVDVGNGVVELRPVAYAPD